MQGFYEIFVIYCNWAGWVHILSLARYPIEIKNGIYIYIIYIYHVYIYKIFPLYIEIYIIIILWTWILGNNPKFLLKSYFIYNYFIIYIYI